MERQEKLLSAGDAPTQDNAKSRAMHINNCLSENLKLQTRRFKAREQYKLMNDVIQVLEHRLYDSPNCSKLSPKMRSSVLAASRNYRSNLLDYFSATKNHILADAFNRLVSEQDVSESKTSTVEKMDSQQVCSTELSVMEVDYQNLTHESANDEVEEAKKQVQAEIIPEESNVRPNEGVRFLNALPSGAPVATVSENVFNIFDDLRLSDDDE